MQKRTEVLEDKILQIVLVEIEKPMGIYRIGKITQN